jgi:hypothetical protein
LGKTESNKPLGRKGLELKYNIKVGLKERDRIVPCKHLARGKGLKKNRMNFRFPQKSGTFLSSSVTVAL